eukprot:GHRQ01000718.1.p1 GENE.GHRQ01000718.1~~GHRQ01000718.1.p1  ORF type:complete len:319 (+),score=138.52 GHRQ01000718.1:277-1233(+)
MSTQCSMAMLLSGWILVTLFAAADACGGHKSHAWDKTVEFKGRRRSLLSFKGRKCGTLTPEPEHLSQLEYKHAVFAAKEAAFQAKNSSSGNVRKYIIPTYVHIIVSDDGTGMGDVAKDVVQKQVQALNQAYATNAQAAGIQWVFQVQSVVKTTGPDMCDQQNEAAMKAKLRKGSRDALNLYVTDLSACGLLGYSSWPWDLKKKGLTMDGVVIHYDTLPGGQYRPYNLGRTGIHEIGHWLGLYHTFQNGCSGNGDAVQDTPFCASPSEGCPVHRDTCPQPGQDPVRNFMDYSDDSCMRAFSKGQHGRVEQMWKQYRLMV